MPGSPKTCHIAATGPNGSIHIHSSPRAQGDSHASITPAHLASYSSAINAQPIENTSDSDLKQSGRKRGRGWSSGYGEYAIVHEDGA